MKALHLAAEVQRIDKKIFDINTKVLRTFRIETFPSSRFLSLKDGKVDQCNKILLKWRTKEAKPEVHPQESIPIFVGCDIFTCSWKFLYLSINKTFILTLACTKYKTKRIILCSNSYCFSWLKFFTWQTLFGPHQF